MAINMFIVHQHPSCDGVLLMQSLLGRWYFYPNIIDYEAWAYKQ